MKNSAPPTSVEKVMREKDLIFSRTDLKGKITYANNIFIEFSGYTHAELIGAQHNIIRHPDMPRAVFKLLWDKIQNKEECCAYVKNMSKDGSFYWVYATVNPSFDENGNPKGYTSCRGKPKQSGLDVVQPLYATMLEAEKKAGAANAIEASSKILTDLLHDKGMSYDEFVKAI